jgi:hypothetical protein
LTRRYRFAGAAVDRGLHRYLNENAVACTVKVHCSDAIQDRVLGNLGAASEQKCSEKGFVERFR